MEYSLESAVALTLQVELALKSIPPDAMEEMSQAFAAMSAIGERHQLRTTQAAVVLSIMVAKIALQSVGDKLDNDAGIRWFLDFTGVAIETATLHERGMRSAGDLPHGAVN